MPTKEKPQKNKKVLVDEKAPLLPRKQEENATGAEFNGASFTGAVFNLSTTTVGAGIMALPATMKVLGIIPGIIMIIFMAYLTEASIEFLLRFTRAGNSASYSGVMGDAFGKCGKILLQICVLVNNVGILIVYMIIIGDVLSGTNSSGVHHTGLLEGWFSGHWWNGRAFVLVFTTLAIFSPLVSFKHIDSLKYTSALSVASALVFLVIAAAVTLYKLVNRSLSMPRFLPDITNFTQFLKLFTVFPILVTAYICHYNVHDIENELEDTSEMKGIVRASLLLCSSIYIMTGLVGFLLFGEETLDDVLANFNTDLGIPYSSFFNDVIRVSYVLHIMLVFPVVFFPLRLNLDGLLFPSGEPLTLNNTRFASLSIGLMCLIYLGAMLIPNIWYAFEFSGATCAVCLGFIFPAAITIADRHGIATNKDRMLAIFMIGLAVLSNAVAIYSNANSLLKRNNTMQ